MKLLIFSEGPSDIGRPEAAWDSETHRGAIRRLSVSVLRDHLKRSIQDHEVEVQQLPRQHRGGGFSAKVVAAIQEAVRQKCNCVAVVIDRDRSSPADHRLRLLQEGRASAQGVADRSVALLATRTALGVAVECMEAWLLADERALSRALGVAVTRQPDPETLNGPPGEDNHPKVRLHTLFSSAPNRERADLREQVASEADQAVVAVRCPSFKRYADDLRQRVV